ncbi:hypothetical protein [Caulobacter hibisci]|uniref:Uncharacterized protein n=1 Tax=Caulobacter hibisci TaxID=2035993 RepID=A0ABS0T5A8_9CAUL|nr:hypothetical protein [Caulobacter hibisci]MBI1687064.1 hypothetical protein [Caulobacter hibisci]
MNAEPQPSKVSPRLLRILIFAAVAAPVGYGLGHWMKRGAWTIHLPPSDALTLVLASVLVLSGLIVMATAANRMALGKRINGEAGRAATPDQVRFYVGQGGVMLLAGVMLAAPPLAVALFNPLSPLLASAVMTGLIALFLLQTVGNIGLWMRCDELMRRVMAETAAVSFVLLQGLLFLWAAGEKLALLPAMTLWDAFNVTMIGYLVISVLVGWRRGLVE